MPILAVIGRIAVAILVIFRRIIKIRVGRDRQRENAFARAEANSGKSRLVGPDIGKNRLPSIAPVAAGRVPPAVPDTSMAKESCPPADVTDAFTISKFASIAAFFGVSILPANAGNAIAVNAVAMEILTMTILPISS